METWAVCFLVVVATTSCWAVLGLGLGCLRFLASGGEATALILIGPAEAAA